ncbi:hypothetical protein DMUE_1413 [Dictyocoela muelleri]|nr:hypothetical protein DMUE_1413 [Dictyocoela muelleri]
MHRLNKMNISFNFMKSNFFKGEVIYLNNKISKQDIQADISRVEAINLKIPKIGKVTMKKIKSIIGSLEWFIPFIPNLSPKIEKLKNKTKNKRILEWTEDDKNLFERIIREIRRNTLLVHPKLTKNLLLNAMHLIIQLVQL